MRTVSELSKQYFISLGIPEQLAEKVLQEEVEYREKLETFIRSIQADALKFAASIDNGLECSCSQSLRNKILDIAQKIKRGEG